MQFFTHSLQGLGHSTQPHPDVGDKGNWYLVGGSGQIYNKYAIFLDKYAIFHQKYMYF